MHDYKIFSKLKNNIVSELNTSLLYHEVFEQMTESIENEELHNSIDEVILELQERFISHLNLNYNNLYNVITEKMIIDLNDKFNDLKLYDFVIEKIAQK
ncbi:hypothetical protein OC709_02150 ['Planchonia careya' phytoplasma]|nr:hypothetical protein ['Planchonia careya' phytoplasma]MDO8030300.1 hypothetical protein ['Planchonia careya' phytoplasma]